MLRNSLYLVLKEEFPGRQVEMRKDLFLVLEEQLNLINNECQCLSCDNDFAVSE